MNTKFWMCFVEGSCGCRYQHRSKELAFEEAERLARLESNRGKKVFVIESVSYCKTEIMPVIWVETH